MNQHASKSWAALTGSAILLGAASMAFAGEKSPIMAPPPPPPADCDGCVNPGFYLSGSLLYLNAYNSDISEFEGEWDLGYRGSVGWESDTGLFVELTGFYHETDYEGENGVVTGDFEAHYIDLVIGDTIHCGEVCLSVAAGLRYAGFEFNEDWGGMPQDSDFDGWGPVLAIEATRALSERFGLYATLRQALLFGESEFYDGTGTYDTDTLASVTEIGAGVHIDLWTAAFLRLGFEGQYWLVDDAHVGLFGGVLELGANF